MLELQKLADVAGRLTLDTWSKAFKFWIMLYSLEMHEKYKGVCTKSILIIQ